MAETILLVEDDESLRRLAQRLLTKLGYRVLPADDGWAAIAHCQDGPDEIHLLITDVFMPDIAGTELAKRLVGLRPAMKVLFVSGSDDVVRIGGLAQDANFLQKPYTQEQISKMIRDILDS